MRSIKKHTTVDLAQVTQLREDRLITERNEDDAVMGQGGESGIDGHFLPSTRGTGGNEDTGVLARESTLDPEATSSIPKDLWRVMIQPRLSYLIDAVVNLGSPSTARGKNRNEWGHRRCRHRS